MSRRLPLSLLPLCLLLVLFVSPVVLQAAPADEQAPATPKVADAPSATDQPTAVASRCQRCGDGYCARSCENEFTCPADCAPRSEVAARCGKCGDGNCVRQCGETAETCPVDCGGSPSVSAQAATKADQCAANKSAGAAAAPADAKKE